MRYFGKVIEGTEIIDNIYSQEEVVGEKDESLKAILKPFKNKIIIKQATVDITTMPEVKVEKYFDFDNYLLETVKKQIESGKNTNIEVEE